MRTPIYTLLHRYATLDGYYVVAAYTTREAAEEEVDRLYTERNSEDRSSYEVQAAVLHGPLGPPQEEHYTWTREH